MYSGQICILTPLYGLSWALFLCTTPMNFLATPLQNCQTPSASWLSLELGKPFSHNHLHQMQPGWAAPAFHAVDAGPIAAPDTAKRPTPTLQKHCERGGGCAAALETNTIFVLSPSNGNAGEELSMSVQSRHDLGCRGTS